jgi:hypothetical protein
MCLLRSMIFIGHIRSINKTRCHPHVERIISINIVLIVPYFTFESENELLYECLDIEWSALQTEIFGNILPVYFFGR